MSYSIGVMIGIDAQKWIIIHDERVPGIAPQGDPSRYAYIPVSPVGAPLWMLLVPNGSWLSLEALLSGVPQNAAIPPKQVGPTVLDLAPFLSTGSGGIWLSPSKVSRLTFPIVDGGGVRTDLTVLIDGAFGRIGLSRSDRDPSQARTFPLSVLFSS